MLVLNNDDISNLLSLNEIISSVESALIAMENNECIVPKRMHLDWDKNTFLVMPSFSATHYGTKLVSVIPDNNLKHLPVTNGVMVLNCKETGMPVALLNAAKLTALRTGSLGAIGVKYMTPENSDSIGLIGYGAQGIQQAIFSCAVRPIKKIYCLLRSLEGFEKLKLAVYSQFPKVEVIACQTVEDVLLKTNILIAATTSPTPVFPNNKEILKGKHFISIGSYKPSMQELPDAVFELAKCLAIDSEFARVETGDSILPVQKKIIEESNVFTIGKLINKTRQINVHETTAYKSAGMALFDLYVGQTMYEKAIEKNIGTIIQL